MKKVVAVLFVVGILLVSVNPGVCEGLSVKEFEKKVNEFVDRVLDGQKTDFVETKKQLLSDIYMTTSPDNFFVKIESVGRISKGLSFDIEKRFAATKTAPEFQSAKDRYAEWNDFCYRVDQAPNDYYKGYIQELILDKERKTILPFEVGPAKWEAQNVSSKEIEVYQKELAAADKVVLKALAALKSNNEAEFAGCFPEKLQLLRRAEPEYSEINRIFKQELADHWNKGATMETAPVFVRNDLEDAARQYQENGTVKSVIRRIKGDQATFAAIVLEKQDGKNYVITQWARGFDMMNRRR
jgi:DNA-binding ferritin-like protein (Dps family)